MKDYKSFLASKHESAQAVGFSVDDAQINPKLFDWQRQVVKWACAQGRAALFEECGMGKTIQQIEWARLVSEHSSGRVIVLSPLAVAHQTVNEAAKIGVTASYCRSQDEADASNARVIVANYEMLSKFNAGAFSGVVLDESSILKSFSGAIRNQLIDAFSRTPYRLACTATPSPNDQMELGNHAEFLGVMQRVKMLAMYFKHDGGDTAIWRLKKHAEKDFWRWVTGWAVCLSKPSDLGYSDEGYNLPALHLHEHVVDVDHTRAHAQGRLFMDGTVSATSMWAEKRETLVERCSMAQSITQQDADEYQVIWCDTNDEANCLAELLPNAVEVRGSDSVSQKEARLSAFSDGKARQIITKPDIAGFGLNWQHATRHVFVGMSYSFEKTYQALRRSWRFGQKNEVNAHLIFAESEGSIRQSLQRKQLAHAEMQERMTEAMHENGLVVKNNSRKPTIKTSKMSIPAWMN